jgi:hypothetical protein
VKQVVIGLVALVAAVSLGACGHPRTNADELRAAVDHTRSMSRRFVYTTKSGGQDVTVQGFVEDDLRFQSTVSIGHGPVLDEVVRDDAVADHFRDPASVDLFVRPAATPPPDALATLRTGRWVIDPHGAPSLAPAPRGVATGFDPMLESIQVFDFINDAVHQAQSVVKYNTEDVSYSGKTDPFPKPSPGVIRYDLIAPPLPRQGTGGSLNQAVPSVSNFRKMAVYVKGGIIQSVRETIDVRSKLQDFVHLYGAKLPPNASPDAQAAFAIDVTNNIRKGQGQEPIAVRDMTLTLSDVGAPLTVAIPPDAVTADLSVLANLGPRLRTTLG